MSSSVGNNVPLTAPPEEQFGAHDADPGLAARRLVPARAGSSRPAGEPMEAKLALARWIVARSHGEEEARRAEEHFTRVVREQEAPDDVPEVSLEQDGVVYLPAALKEWFGLSSTSEARRLIEQGGGQDGRGGRHRARACVVPPRGRARPGGKAALRTGFCR